jgi:hypothetical protein
MKLMVVDEFGDNYSFDKIDPDSARVSNGNDLLQIILNGEVIASFNRFSSFRFSEDKE